MKTIVATRNPDLARDFARDLLRRRDLRLVTADTTRDLLHLLRQGADLCFVDRVLVDGDCDEAVAAIRSDKKLQALPVILMVTEGAPRPADPLAHGFTDVVELPSAPGALTLLIGRHLGVALRDGDRRAVRVHVSGGDASADATASAYLGTSVDLSEMGMLLRTIDKGELHAGQQLALRFALPGQAAELCLRAAIVRVDEKGFAPARGLALSFVDIAPAERAVLDAYLSDLHGGWPFRVALSRAPTTGSAATVTLVGTLDASSDTSALEALTGVVDAQLRDLRHVTSESAQLWQELVKRSSVTRWRLHECPIGFVHQANRAPTLLDRAEVVSFHAPYACPGCGLEDERVVAIAEVSARQPPPFRCRACEQPMRFDDLPEAYFAFLGEAISSR